MGHLKMLNRCDSVDWCDALSPLSPCPHPRRYSTAIQILGDNGWLDILIDKCRSLNKLERKALAQAATIFRAAGNHQYAKEVFLKMEDSKQLLKLHIELHKWDEAFNLVQQNPELADNIYQPYAEWLAINDRFDEAQEAFKKAGKPEQSLRLLESLTHNAVTEHRYQDASYYFWKLAEEHLKSVTATGPHLVTAEDREKILKYHAASQKADLYFAYHTIFRYTDDPFVTAQPETIFNAAQFILNGLGSGPSPHGLSRVFTLVALAKQAKALGAFKLARKVYERLAGLQVPVSWRAPLELGALTVRSKRFADRDDLLPVCGRCSSPNPLLNSQADTCVNCHSAFFRSFVTFDTLPLVSFDVDPRLSPAEVRACIDALPPSKGSKRRDSDRVNAQGNVQTLRIDDDDEDDEDGDGHGGDVDDAFHRQLLHTEPDADGSLPPIQVDALTLQGMRRDEVWHGGNCALCCSSVM
jgi:intraflagellar transport protein 122